MGIDPGSRKAGWGVIQVQGQKMQAVEFGVIRLPVKESLGIRLEKLYAELSRLTKLFKPDQIAMESVFQPGNVKNYKSVITLGHARGVALLALVQSGLPVAEYPPATVKKAVAGRGRADKWQMQQMVRTLLSLKDPPAEDAADALAVAMCHAMHASNPILRQLR